MATYSHSIALVDTGGGYSLLGTQALSVGDTIQLTVSFGSGWTAGSSDSITETGGWPVASPTPNQAISSGGSAVWSYTVEEEDPWGVATNGRNLHIHFFGSTGTPYWNYVTDFRGKFRLQVAQGDVCTAGPAGTITSITIPTTEAASVACTINGLTAGDNCNIESRARTEAEHNSDASVAWFPGLVRNATRGTSYVFQARNAEFPNDIESSSVTAIPYLATDMDVGVANNTVTADATTGYWQQTVTNISGNYNNYRTYVGNTPLMRGSTPPQSNQYLNTGVGGNLIDNQHIGNAPAVGESLTVTLWGGRTAASGGSGIPGFTATTTSFTVVRAVGHSETITDTTGSYYDHDPFTTGASHTVLLSNLTTNWEYAIGDVSGNIDSPLSGWTGSGSVVKTVADPNAPADTAKTYYVWRRDGDGNNVAKITNPTYTRTLRNYSRFSFQTDPVPLAGTDTTFTQSIGNGIAGHFYYIYNGANLRGWAWPQSDGTFTINVTESAIPNVGDETTHYFYSLSAQNSVRTQHYYTGKTYKVQRTGSGGTDDPPPPSTYGLDIWNADETRKLYDTTSRTGRIMVSGRAPSTGTISHNGTHTVNVTGLQNTTDYQVLFVPESGGSATTAAGYLATVTKTNGSFTITNKSGVDNAYQYHVIKTGG